MTQQSLGLPSRFADAKPEELARAYFSAVYMIRRLNPSDISKPIAALMEVYKNATGVLQLRAYNALKENRYNG